MRVKVPLEPCNEGYVNVYVHLNMNTAVFFNIRKPERQEAYLEKGLQESSCSSFVV